MIFIVGIVFLITLFFSLAEAYYERDLPRRTVIFLLAMAVAMLFTVGANAQNTRFDYSAYTVTGVGNLLPVLAIPGASVSFYTSCTALPCSTHANVYTSSSGTTACANTAQIVLNGTSSCVSVADNEGNFGGWFLPGQYQYTITAFSSTYGPYSFTIGYNSGSFTFPISIANGGTGQTTSAAALAALGGFPLSSLPVSIANGGTGQTSGIAALNALGAANGTTPIVFGNTFAAPVITSIASFPISVKTFGAIGNGTADDTASLQAAINYMAAFPSSSIYLPCGIYKTTAQLTYTAPQAPSASGTIFGEGSNCTKIYYQGSSSVSAVFEVTTGVSATYFQDFAIRNITLEGNANVTIADLYLVRPSAIDFQKVRMWGASTTTGACLYVFSGVAGKYDQPICSIFVDQSNANGPFNQLVWDGSNSNDESTTTTVISPNVGGAASNTGGVAIYLKSAQGMFFSGCQVSGVSQGLNISATSAQNTFSNCLFENQGIASYIAGSQETITGSTFSQFSFSGADAVLVAGGDNIVEYSLMGQPIYTTSATGNRFSYDIIIPPFYDPGIGNSSDHITYQNPGSGYNQVQAYSATAIPTGFVGSGINGMQVIGPSGWVLGGTDILSPIQITTAKSWRAIIIGTFSNNGNSGAGYPIFQEINETNNTITISGGTTLTFSVTGAGFQLTGGGGTQVFQGVIYFMPDVSATTSGKVAMNFADGIGASQFNPTAAQTTLSCSTSGSATFSQPAAGSSFKDVIIHLSSCIGIATYTYPVAFSFTPQVLSQSYASIVNSITSTAVQITGATTTGFIYLNGY